MSLPGVGIVWITCPTTGRHYSTGIETDQGTPLVIPVWAARYRCAACGEVHPWPDVQAVLIDEPPSLIH